MAFRPVIGLICILLLSPGLLAVPAAADTKAAPAPYRQALKPLAKHHVLFINSYHNGYTWSDDILDGYRAVFADNRDRIGPVDLQVEYLDTKKYPNPELRRDLKDHLAKKFAKTPFDVILISDNSAYQFIMRNADELFPGVPIVFCGVNDFHAAALSDKENITGVVENSRVADNLRIALSLHPSARRVTVIGDNSTTSLAIEEQARYVEPKFAGRLAFDYHHVSSLPEIDRLLSELPKNGLIFMLPFYIDQNGSFYDASEVMAYVAAHTDHPIYSCWDFQLGHGMVGGRLLSGFEHGKAAARMAVRILNGEPPRSIPVEYETDDPLLFDYAVLTRMGIEVDQLPVGSQLVNQPQLFYELKKPVFWGIIASLFGLTAILVLLVVNIVRRREMERQVMDQLHFLRLLMDTIPIPLYFQDVTGTFGLFNASFEHWFCRKGHEPCSGKCLSAQCKGLATLADERDAGLLEKPGVTIYERSVKSVDGASHDVLVHKATHTNARGAIEGIVGVLYDITDRKRAEQGLRESQAMLRTVLDTIPQSVYWKSADDHFMGCNQAFARFYHFNSPDEVVGLAGKEVFPPANAEWGEQVEREVLLNGKSRQRLIRQVAKPDGEIRTVEITKVPLLSDGGKVVGVLSTAEDVTVKMDLERQLLRSQKMEAIGTFVSGIAHDFNNILTTIINSAELALLDVEEETETAQDIRRALSAARQGSQLVKQIHTYSRPSREGLRPLDVSRVIREAQDLVRASLPANITLKSEVDANAPAALADPSQIHQVLMNLCTNAFQALRETGGEIVIGLTASKLDEPLASRLGVEPGNYLKLSVADNGPGIPEDIRDKIFDPFFTTKAPGEGTGLGLAVVQGIVRGHKGGIHMVSTPEKETSIEVYLPMAPSEEIVCHQPEAQSTNGAERVLFVEDDPDQLQTVPRVLRRMGYQVTACHGADEALRAIKSNGKQYDVVVTDFDMPGTDGVDFSRSLADLRPQLPVVMVSGRPGSLASAAKAPNIRHVLPKPYSGQDLSGAIRAVMEN